MTMVGTQAPQKLFGGVPAEVGQIPGMVTPNITAAMPSYVDWGAVQAAQNMAKARSGAGWGRAAASNAAADAEQRKNEERARLRSAFDELYGPQIQNQYNDQMVNLEGTTTPQGTVIPKRQGTTTHPLNAFSSNKTVADQYNQKAPGAVATPGGGGYLTPYRLGDEEVRRRLDNMWRMRTDPYLKAAMTMGISGMG